MNVGPHRPHHLTPHHSSTTPHKHSASTTDDRATVVLNTDNQRNSVELFPNDEIFFTGLPLLEEGMPMVDSCLHDSGANRHISHDKNGF